MSAASPVPRSPGGLFGFRLRAAQAALWWERVWPEFWPAFGIVGIFAVLVLFNLLPQLPAPLHAAVLLALGGAFLFTAIRAARRLTFPDILAARRRIEQASGLPHRPLAALADQPSAPLDSQSAQLWEAHRRRMAASARRLRFAWPKAGLAPYDPWGLRALLGLLLLLGAVDAGSAWRERLVNALTPNFASGPPPIAPSLDVWVTPPEYTRLPPEFLRPGERGTVAIPIGSKLLAQIHGGDAVPQLVIDSKSTKFTAIDKENFEASAILRKATRLALTQSGTALASWPVRIVPDLPPKIAFTRPPTGTAQKALRIDYRATDDYGVESVAAVIHRLGGKPGSVIRLSLPLPGLHDKIAKATSYTDLTASPWAGLPVEIHLVAKDALGQAGRSPIFRMRLPERVFHNPVARAIIEQRKELVAHPDSREAVAEILGDLSHQQPLYHDDQVVFLALRFAQDELRASTAPAATNEVLRLLWDTALRIEDRGVPLAENRLRRLERQLQQALAQHAPNRQIEQLMRQLREALQSYLSALAKKFAEQPHQAPIGPHRMISSRDLERMLDRAQQLAENGDRQAAQQLLSQLQNMLENLRSAQPSAAQQKAAQNAQQMLQGMRKLMQRQQQLLDQSFAAAQRAQQGRPGQQGSQGQQGGFGQHGGLGQPQFGSPGGNPGAPQDMGQAAQQQENLRRSLGDIMRRLGEAMGDIPSPFGRAERAMRNATGALQQGDPAGAIGPQTEALDQLQQAARDFAQAMQRRLGTAWGNQAGGNMTDQLGEGLNRDPLGRPVSGDGGYDAGDVKIPDHGKIDEARKILEELRRRAGERYRPQLELNYIERLLKRF